MMIVSSPQAPPHRCAVTGRSEDQVGFVDTGITLPSIDPRIYVSHQGVIRLNEMFGLPDPFRHVQVLERCEELAARVVALENRNAELEGALAAVETLKNYGYTAHKKPGRPPTKKREKVTA